MVKAQEEKGEPTVPLSSDDDLLGPIVPPTPDVHGGGDEYDERELRALAESLAPAVSKMLSDEALENLLGNDLYGADGILSDLPMSPQRQTLEDTRRERRRMLDDSFGEGGDGGGSGGVGVDDDGDNDDDDSDGDGVEGEWNRLEAAQENLREELELAQGGLSLLAVGTPAAFLSLADDADEHDEDVDIDGEEGVDDGGDGPFDRSDDGRRSSGADLNAEVDGSIRRRTGVDPRTPPPPSTIAVGKPAQWNDEWEIPASATTTPPLLRDGRRRMRPTPSSTSAIIGSTTPQTQQRQRRRRHTLLDHAQSIGLKWDDSDLGCYTCPLMSPADAERSGLVTLPPWIHGGDDDDGRGSVDRGTYEERRDNLLRAVVDCTREFVVPPPGKVLRRIYAGLSDAATSRAPPQGESNDGTVTTYDATTSGEDDDAGAGATATVVEETEALPVRTISIRIRPDVLCGAVMDALTHAVETLEGEMTKRQGGHLRAALPGCWIGGGGPSSSSLGGGEHDFDDGGSVASGVSSLWSFASPSVVGGGGGRGRRRPPPLGRRMMPPYFIDAQLCSRKRGRECERVLLLRIYDRKVHGDGAGDEEDGEAGPAPPASSYELAEEDTASEMEGYGPGIALLREAAALAQRIQRSVARGDGDDDGSLDMATPTAAPGGRDEVPRTVGSAASSSSVVRQFGSMLVSPMRLLAGTSSNGSVLASRNPASGDGIVSECHDPESVRQSISSRLLDGMLPSPSVRNHRGKTVGEIMPVLSFDDCPYVQSSWRFIKECLSELDNRDLAHSTLSTNVFGQFPALPTLDVHYCSQIRLLCRENMIKALLKAASELEQFARESEYSCANLIQLLRPTFETYQLEPPALPTPVPLTAYPLDFQPPEASCPPWGQKVMEALNQIAKTSSMENSAAGQTQPSYSSDRADRKEKQLAVEIDKNVIGFKKAEDAVSLVISAFQRQDDEEQGARLGRKNVQVMDRLAKMQAHKRASVITIRDSYGKNVTATKVADHFHKFAEKVSFGSKPSGDLTVPVYTAADQVPLLKCSIMLGGSTATGTCYVTAYQMLFVTQLIPIIGGNRIHLVSIVDADLVIQPPSSSMLNPLPASISIHSNSSNKEKELFNFIPSIGAQRFIKFIEVVKEIEENPNTLKFSARGGLLYMFDESRFPSESTLSGQSDGAESQGVP